VVTNHWPFAVSGLEGKGSSGNIQNDLTAWLYKGSSQQTTQVKRFLSPETRLKAAGGRRLPNA
jgi:hypothetical protein